MSRLFGPFSVTRSKVSLRDCACAEKTAGAVTAALAASADADLRKSRRFIESSPDRPGWSMRQSSSGVPDRRGVRSHEAKRLFELVESEEFADREPPGQFAGIRALHTMHLYSANFYALPAHRQTAGWYHCAPLDSLPLLKESIG